MSNLPFRFFDDFEPGQVIDLGTYRVSAEEIVEFAAEFDPAPFHLDAEAGRDSMLGGHAASGWHGSAIAMRLLCDGLLLNSSCQGSPGVEEARWRKPILAGDVVSGQITVLGKRPMKSRPGIGLVEIALDFFTSGNTPALSLRQFVMFAERAKGVETGGTDTP